MVTDPFSIPRSRCSAVSDPLLRDELLARTGSDEEASSILRSIERFGNDLSIDYYEMTPIPTRRTYHSAKTVGWTVRAVRGE